MKNAPQSDRLFFRRLDPEDVGEQYVAWLNDPLVNQYLEVRHSVQTVESCLEFVINTNADPNSHLFGIFSKETHQHIGNAKIGFIKTHYLSGELSLFIGDKSFWGKGLGTEIVRAMTQYGFGPLGLKRLEAGCYEQNMGSFRAFLQAGYAVEGYLRRSVVLNGKRQGCFRLGALKGERLPDE